MTGPPGRALGLDLGTRRIGVALSDDARLVASPLTMLLRSSTRAEDHREIAALVTATGSGVVVVGLPLSLNGARGPAASAVLAEVGELCRLLDVPVELCDERFTTVVANQALAATARRPSGKRDVVDMTAAAGILQTWLDKERGRAANVGPEAGRDGGAGLDRGTGRAS